MDQELVTPTQKAIVLFYKYFITSEIPRVFSENSSYYVDKIEEFQKRLCCDLGLKGRILLSVEGINGTLSGDDRSAIQSYIKAMESFDLFDGCGSPSDPPPAKLDDNDEEASKRFLFRSIDWKESFADNGVDEPFPDLKISVVKEIVSTGGKIKADDIPERTGKHLSPAEFHKTLAEEQNVVLIDVRNTFEHDIGHFVAPTGIAAMNPEMTTFSSFDTNFCAKQADNLKDKKVLMYCTGGIR